MKHLYQVNGQPVPGVTSVMALRAKNALPAWAWKVSRENPDFKSLKAFSQVKMDTGTLTHSMIHNYLWAKLPIKTEVEPKVDYEKYSKEQINAAENAFISFLEWDKKNNLDPRYLELSLTSEMYGYGGTIDCYGWIGHKQVIIDFKTGGIWPEHQSQIAAYRQLVWEFGGSVEQGLILSVPIAEDEKFQEQYITDFGKPWRIFYHLLQIYKEELK